MCPCLLVYRWVVEGGIGDEEDLVVCDAEAEFVALDVEAKDTSLNSSGLFKG